MTTNTQELKLMSMNLAMHNYRVYDNKTQANKMITILTFAQFLVKVITHYNKTLQNVNFLALIDLVFYQDKDW